MYFICISPEEEEESSMTPMAAKKMIARMVKISHGMRRPAFSW